MAVGHRRPRHCPQLRAGVAGFVVPGYNEIDQRRPNGVYELEYHRIMKNVDEFSAANMGRMTIALSSSGFMNVSRTDGQAALYAFDSSIKAWVEIDPDQAWFWTPEWQARERLADEDLKLGRYEDLKDDDDLDAFFDSL
jgi:hypothetical protein